MVGRAAALASAASLLVGLAACSSGGQEQAGGDDEPRILRIGTATALTSLDPALSASGGTSFLSPVYESLIRRDPEGLLQPGLATEWALSDGATKLELTLREGVTFHDGEPFDAAAVKANLDAAPDRGGQIASQLAIITDVEVVDDHHLVLSVSRPAADLLGVLASEAGMMISPKALGAADLGTNPVGTGPFTVDDQDQNGISYEAWDGYWNKDRIKLDRLEFVRLDDDQTRLNAVLTDEVQAALQRYPQIEEQEARAPDTVVSLVAGVAIIYGIVVNAQQGEWANPAMRQAAMHAIDREGISNAIYGGSGGCTPIVQPFPTNYWASDPALETSDAGEYDPDLARELLEEAGLVGVKVKLFVGSLTAFQNMAAALQQQLNAVGMDVTVESFDTATLTDLRARGEFEASIASVQPGRPDPAQFLEQYYMPDGVYNYGNEEYPGVEEALDAMNATVDQDERADYVHDIMKSVLEVGPTLIPICAPTSVLMHSADVGGLSIPVNYDYDYTYAYYKDDE